ncbi:hypothetical protein LP419_37790 [Massilia sp. H-1]|nr:hypothetical protein LP419_37790 [Massilia sp. H-1]
MRVDFRRDDAERQDEDEGGKEDDPQARHPVDRIIRECARVRSLVEQTAADQPAAEQKEHDNRLVGEAGEKRQALECDAGVGHRGISRVDLGPQVRRGDFERCQAAQERDEQRVGIVLAQVRARE